MNKTLIARLVIGAVATIAAGGAMAGQIQASSVSIAREVITTDAQTVLAPSIAYRFAGDVDARVQAQTFQVQFTLAAGEWALAPTAAAISVSDGVSGVIQDQSAVAPVATAASYTVIASGLSTDKKTMWATINVNQGATALVKQPIISLNVTSNLIANVVTNVSAARGTVSKLFSVVGDLLADYASSGKCVDVKTLAVDFKHFTALTNPNAMVLVPGTDGQADEHVRGGATNNATLMTFPTNLKVDVTAATGGVTLAAGGKLTFVLKSAGTAFVDLNNALLGTVALKQNAVGYDSDLSNQYLLSSAAASAIGVAGVATAVSNVGPVEAKSLKVVVSATDGYVVGGTLALNTAANCAAGTRVAGAGTVAITAANAAGPITLTVPTASLAGVVGAAGTNAAHVCYTNPGTVTIPSSSFSAVATLEKAEPGANLDEQDNICSGNYISLGGGLKIDLRNYASSKETSGYTSIVRFVNNSDAATADVWAQIIHQDGKLGGWGKVIDALAPRAVLNMTAAQIEAKLTNAPTAAIGATAVAPETNNTGAPRLRITSNSGKSLRVQNYMYNSATGQILEVSGAQGVDFEGTVDRAPLSEGQYQIQDANSGLNLQ